MREKHFKCNLGYRRLYGQTMKRNLFSLANELEAELKNYLDVLIIINYLTVEPTTNERTTSIILNQHVPKLCSVAQMEKKRPF